MNKRPFEQSPIQFSDKCCLKNTRDFSYASPIVAIIFDDQ